METIGRDLFIAGIVVGGLLFAAGAGVTLGGRAYHLHRERVAHERFVASCVQIAPADKCEELWAAR